MSLKAKIFGFILIIVFFTTSCGAQGLPQEFPTSIPITLESEVPQVTAPPEVSMQKELFFKIPHLIQEIIENPLADLKIKNHLSNCEYYMQDGGETHFDYEGNSKCLILVGRNIPDDYIIAVARSLVNVKTGETLSYAIFYPYELSDETWKRVIYHEAVHMVDYLEDSGCVGSEIDCSVKDEFYAHYKTMILFQDYMIQNGFTLEQLSSLNSRDEQDPIVQFAIENSISQDDFNIFMQDVTLLYAKLNGSLNWYLIEVLSPLDE